MTPVLNRSPRPLLVVGLFYLATAVAYAQTGSVRSEVDARRIGVDDVATLSIVLDGEAVGLDAALPPLRNLHVVGGPSTSTQISFVNGSMSRQKILSFVLKAEKPGSAEIGPVSVPGYPPAPAITIEVVPGAIRPAQTQDPFGRDPFGGRDPFEEIFGRPQRRQPATQGKLFVEATLSRPAARVGEPILVTYFVYTQISLSGVEFAEAPKYPGFWAEEIERSRDSAGTNVSVQGEAYLRYPVLERLLFPTKTGLLEIPEARLRLVPTGGVFGVAAPIERGTKALRVQVDPLPNGTPEGSAVGSYQAMASVDRAAILLGDAITFRFKVQGRGNLKWIDAAPKIEIPGVRIFPPRVTSDLKTTRQGIEGSKTWEFVLVPEREGTYEIPAISFPYFDPEKPGLRTETTERIPVEVSPVQASGAASSTKAAPSGVALRAELDGRDSDFSRPALALAFASLLAQIYLGRRRGVPAGRSIRDRAALLAALREIQDESILTGTKERATVRMSGALESVFGPRAAWPNDDAGDRLRSLADELEFLRFAPQLGSYETKLKEVRDRAVALLEAVQ